MAAATGTLYLVDAHSLIFQVFHAIRDRMSSPSGMPTNALFGFTRDLLFLRGLRPDYLLCAFDRAEPTFRSDLYADYKAHRAEMPGDLQLQLPLIGRVLEALNVPAISHPRFEADDVLATIARVGAQRGLDVYLCTSDKDCRQLIDDHVRLFNLRKRQEFGRAELLADWGVTPEQVVDLQTLVGDSVDNVPGVKGIGLKTGAKLLQDFGTLENVLANIDKVPGAKKQEALRDSVATIPLTRQLVRLATDVPVKIDWDAWKLREPDAPRLVTLFQEWGFHSLANQFRGAEPPAAAPAVQGELFPFGANAPAGEAPNGAVEAHGKPDWPHTYHLVDTAAKFDAFFKELKKQKRFAFDTETTSLQPLEAEIVGCSFAWHPGEAWYLALRGPAGSATLDPAKALKKLRTVLEDEKVAKVNQNIKYDLLVLRGQGVEPRGVAGDPMVADYLLHAGERSHSLESLAAKYLNHQVIPITDLIGKKTKKQPQLTMDQVPTERVAEYAGEDADVAWRLTELLEERLGQGDGGPALRKLYDEVEVPLIEVLAELEYNGIRLDVPLLQRLGEEMGKQLAAIEQEIYRLAGHPFNIGSLVQLRKVLFDELKLPVQGKTGVTGAPSTDQETLEKLAALDNPNSTLPRKILEHRQIAKLKSTYVDALPEMMNKKTGRVHASFNQTVASTGRLSGSDPNLQNIPVRREQGQQIRQAFIPEAGWVLLTADYSQIELRLLAHFCGDEALRQAFAEGRDVHAAVAAQIFGVPEKDVTDDQRRLAKTVNFGVLYGMSAGGLAQRLHIPKEEAAQFITAYFARYPKVAEYQTRLLAECRRTGYVGTILGRRRRFDPEAIRANSTYQQRNGAEREAINMEIQGSAADLMKLAMLRVHRRMKQDGLSAHMLLTVHDELVFETPPAELQRLAALVREEMTTPLEKSLGLQVPLVVDLASGPNWLDVTADDKVTR
ncbi:MAG TPA: DNA polymerase I [Gemmataceae bacterium]|nr:DNA polymerase I [Gemmataceae bacterium]